MGLLDTYLMRFYEHGSLRTSTGSFSWVRWSNVHDVLISVDHSKINKQKKNKKGLKECKHTYIRTRTDPHSHTQTKHLLWAMQVIVSISATLCDSSWKQERVCVLLEQSKTLQLCLALRTHRTCYGLYQAEELVTHLPHLLFHLACLFSDAI